MLVLPPALRPGDRIAIVAPSSPFPGIELWTGLAWLRGRYMLSARRDLLARDGYLAGDDETRKRDLTRAMLEEGTRAIVCARGGYGATRIVRDLPWDEFARNPKWIVGFSDVTTLHLAASARGIASIHGPNATGLGMYRATPRIRASVLASLERPRAIRNWADLKVVHGGSAEGQLFGGNLSLLQAEAAAGSLVVPAGAVLALEDVTEKPYRVDRMLTSLLAGGYLSRASAIVFGDFSECVPGVDGITIDHVLEERTRALGIPVLAGAPFGHAKMNDAFILGARAKIEGNAVVIGKEGA